MVKRMSVIRLFSAAAVMAVGLAPAAAGAASQAGAWTAWEGCWELVQETAEGEDLTLEGRRLVCMEPGEASRSVRLTTWVDDEVVLLQEIIADGATRPVEEGGCAGTETARFSSDGARVLMSADLVCDGQSLHTSGISLMATSSTWTDIQVSEVGDQRELQVRRYRLTARTGAAPDPAPRDRALAVRTARQVTTAPLDPDDVIEALDHVDPAAVEALLLETGDEFAMDSDLLIRLADADVPAGVVDLMVALSYPDYFAVHEGDADESWDRDRYRRGRWHYGSYYAYSSYYDPFFAPFGYGYYYRRPWGGTVIGGGTPRYRGKVIAGRGYTRVRVRDDAPIGGSGFARLFSRGRDSGGSSVGSGGSNGSSIAQPRSGSGSSGSTGRVAKPRSGGSSSSGSSGGAKPKSGSGGGAKPKSGSGGGSGH